MSLASLLRLIALGAIWGSSFSFMRIAVPEFGPVALIAIRLALAALFLATVAAVLWRPLPIKGHVAHYLFVGAVNSALPFFFFAYAAQSLPAALLAVFNSLAPALGAVVARLWLKTPITGHTAAGLALGVVGVSLIAAESLLKAEVTAGFSATALALVAGVAAPLCYAVVATYIKRKQAAVTPFDNAHGSMWAAMLLTAPFAGLLPPPGTPAPEDWIAVSALGLVCTGAAYILSFRLISDLGPTRALTVTFLVPLFGVIWGVTFLGERLTVLFLCGGLLVVLGTAMANGYLRRNRLTA